MLECPALLSFTFQVKRMQTTKKLMYSYLYILKVCACERGRENINVIIKKIRDNRHK